MVPRTWRRPLTLIYDRNYKYGTGLYSETISEIERRYQRAMARTRTGLSASSLGSGVHYPSQVPPEPWTPSHLLQSGKRRGVRSVPDIDSHLWSMPPRRYLHLLADPFNLEEKARSRRRLRRSQADGSGGHAPAPAPSLHLPEWGTGSFPHFLHPYWGRDYPLSYLSDFPLLSGKCQKLQSVLETVSHRVSDAESKLRWDKVTSGLKGKQEIRVVELEAELQAMGRDNAEQQKVIKRQARQIEELQSLQDELHRHLGQAQEDVVSWQRRFNAQQFEMNTVRHSRFH